MRSPALLARSAVCPSCRLRTPRKTRPGGLCHACVPAAPGSAAPSAHQAPGAAVVPAVGEELPWYHGPHYADPAAKLTPGVLNDAAIDFFTTGQCHALADALHRATGWDVVVVKMPCDGDCEDCVEDPWADIDWETYEGPSDGSDCSNGYAAHAAVLTPDGLLLDAKGLHTPEEMATAYGIEGELWTDYDAVIGLERYAGEVGRWLDRENEGWVSPRRDVAEAFVDVALAAVRPGTPRS